MNADLQEMTDHATVMKKAKGSTAAVGPDAELEHNPDRDTSFRWGGQEGEETPCHQ